MSEMSSIDTFPPRTEFSSIWEPVERVFTDSTTVWPAKLFPLVKFSPILWELLVTSFELISGMSPIKRWVVNVTFGRKILKSTGVSFSETNGLTNIFFHESTTYLGILQTQAFCAVKIRSCQLSTSRLGTEHILREGKKAIWSLLLFGKRKR